MSVFGWLMDMCRDIKKLTLSKMNVLQDINDFGKMNIRELHFKEISCDHIMEEIIKKCSETLQVLHITGSHHTVFLLSRIDRYLIQDLKIDDKYSTHEIKKLPNLPHLNRFELRANLKKPEKVI